MKEIRMNWLQKKFFLWKLKRNIRRHYWKATPRERRLLKDEKGDYFYNPEDGSMRKP